jgi:putative NIF3 family GTP cyclohydrolase 1 type 2
MKIKEILSILEEMAPLAFAEDFDNVGLLVGNQENEATGILVCHDALESVIHEAIAKKCNLVVCFHPIIFSGLKKITGKNYVERSVLKAIKNDIAIYASHTNLDNMQSNTYFVHTFFSNTFLSISSLISACLFVKFCEIASKLLFGKFLIALNLG